MKGFDWVFLDDIGVGIVLTIVEVDQVGRLIVLIVWTAFQTVSSIVSYFSTLEAGVQQISGSSGISLKVVLRAIALVAVVVPLSSEVIATVVATVVSLSSGWCPVSVNVHGDRGIVHPSWHIG